MAKLAKLPGGQQVADYYIKWAQNEHHQMVVNDLVDLNQLQGLQGVHLKWNSTTGDFGLIDANERPIVPRREEATGGTTTQQNIEAANQERAQVILNRINTTGKNMMQIQDSLG